MTVDDPLSDEAVVAFDWAAVESEVGRAIPEGLRRHIERTHDRSGYHYEREGFGEFDTVGMFAALEAHDHLVLPGRGIIEREVYTPMTHLTAGLRATHYGADLNVGTPVKPVIPDGLTFVEGVRDLVDAARALGEQRDDWHKRPQLQVGSFGPDGLGNCFISLGHVDDAVIDELDVPDTITEHGRRGWTPSFSQDFPEHVEATYRHERYYHHEDAPEPYEEEAAELGLLNTNIGTKTALTGALDRQGISYEQLDDLTVRTLSLWVYRYEKEGEERYGVEWSKRVAIDDYVLHSLIFDHRPDADDVEQAALIVNARMDRDSGLF